MRTRRLALALATTAAVLAAGAAAAGSAPPDQLEIVYAQTVHGRGGAASELFRVAGGEPRRLTRNLVNEHQPSWSPRRRRVVYVRTDASGSDIWVMRRDGTGARRLAGSSRAYDAHPAWSPDGKLIAFTSTRAWPQGDGGSELYLMRADGTGVRRLTRTHRWRSDVYPRFSPDGRHLVYASGYGQRFDLFRIRVADGRGVRRLTSGIFGGDDLMPDWSPDGKRIAFVSNRDGDGAWAVVTIDANGGDRRVVKTEPGAWLASPRWAASGSWLVYGATRDDLGGPTLKAVDVGSGGVVEITAGFDGDW
jgi:TolB protein